MTFEEFKGRLLTEVSPCTVFQNPGGGTSRIKSITDERLSYVRGVSTISVRLLDLYSAYRHFAGTRVSSSDLRAFLPSVFDSKARPAGHSCNCTFLFELLGHVGLANSRSGSGTRGAPYSMVIVDAQRPVKNELEQ